MTMPAGPSFEERTADLRARGFHTEAAARDRYAHSMGAAEHTQTDLHAIAEQLAHVDRRQTHILATLGELAVAIAELNAKVTELEAEFAPLARKWTGRAAALSATPAARFVRSKARDQR